MRVGRTVDEPSANTIVHKHILTLAVIHLKQSRMCDKTRPETLPWGCRSNRGWRSKCMLSEFSEWQRESHDSQRWRGLLLFRSRQSGWWQTWKRTKRRGRTRGSGYNHSSINHQSRVKTRPCLDSAVLGWLQRPQWHSWGLLTPTFPPSVPLSGMASNWLKASFSPRPWSGTSLPSNNPPITSREVK